MECLVKQFNMINEQKDSHCCEFMTQTYKVLESSFFDVIMLRD